jgi:hypothetical protein
MGYTPVFLTNTPCGKARLHEDNDEGEDDDAAGHHWNQYSSVQFWIRRTTKKGEKPSDSEKKIINIYSRNN